jgi:N utilization substance protein B
VIDAESPSSTHAPETNAAAPRTRTSGKSSKNSLRRRSRELALQGLYDWLLSREQVSEIELHMRAQDDFLPCDEAHFEALLRGCIVQAGVIDLALGRLVDPTAGPERHPPAPVARYRDGIACVD